MTGERRKRILLLWNTVGKTLLAKVFSSNMGDTKYPSLCIRRKLPGRGVHSEKVRY